MNLLSWLGLARRSKDGRGFRIFSHSRSNSGENVNAQSIMQLSAAWACTRLIAETIATLPIGVYRRNDQGRVSVDDHPVAQLLKHSPNAEQTPAEFIEGLAAGLPLWGNSFAEKKRIGNRIVALHPILPEKMTVFRDESGALKYKELLSGGKYKIHDERDILHCRGFGFGSELGVSAIAMGANSLGNAIAADNASGSMYRNGLTPPGVLTVDNILTKQQRDDIATNVLAPLAGAMQAGKTMLLEGGMKYESITMNPDDVQMLETRKFNIEEICRWFRVPPIMVGHSADGQTMWGSGVEQIMIGWLTTGLRPYLTRLEQRFEKELLTPIEQKELTIRFNVEGLLRGDTKARAEYYSKALQNGWLNRNEVRGLENKDKIDGLDVMTVQSNMASIDEDGKIILPENRKENSDV